ncbi:type I polyketide synthase [Sorangium sp. So ce1153]|uniref:type I polyketide synthase n=1 Tax=Sorangium sp. So ce1153 TaxID=3133333 RepID=UPI003F5EED6A
MSNDATLSPLKQALLAIERLEARVRRAESAARAPLAIVGMGCRFPGGADSPAALWELLREGRDATRDVPRARWDVEAWYSDDPDAPGKMNVRRGGFLDDIASFDPGFFGVSPRAAAAMDPQHRLLLEVGWEALEDAALAPQALRGSSTGVFVGITSGEYGTLLLRHGGPAGFDGQCLMGTPLYSAAGRLSYTLGLHGPSMSVDTACSSSLTALHLACQSLRNGECRWALAAGVNLLMVPEMTTALCRTGALAPDGRCKTFDASADGFARGEGCGVLVLMRLEDALADGCRVRAIVCSSGVNHDGASSGFTVPNGRAQESLIRKVWQEGRVEPSEVDYVEAHGTGTELGDPVEMRALVGALGQARPADRPLLVGSAKTNLGHCESAAGMAGVMKVVLALEHGEIPAHLHVERPSPHIPWDEIPVRVPRERTPWPRGDRRRVAAVSAFGLGGTNTHVLLAEAPSAAPAEAPSAAPRPWHLLCLSARSEAALVEQARRLRAHLAARPEQRLADVAYTTSVGRAHFARRAVVRAADARGAIAALDALIEGRADPALHVGRVADPLPRAAFLFQGRGAEHAGMGRALYEGAPVFRETLDRCGELLRPRLPHPLPRLLWGEEAAGGRIDARLAGPALLALEVALAETWRSFGVAPRAVAGHDVGELAAACVAGVIPLDEALARAADASGAPVLPAGDRAPRTTLCVGPKDLEGSAHLLEVGPVGPGRDEWQLLCDRLAALHVEGCPIDWEAFARGAEGKRVGLPTYPFERRRCWVEDAVFREAPLEISAAVNGAVVNDTVVNVAAVNGAAVNGAAVNGAAVNGVAVNGVAVNGAAPQAAELGVDSRSSSHDMLPLPAELSIVQAGVLASPGGEIERIMAEQLRTLSHVLAEQLGFLEQMAGVPLDSR